MSQVQTKCDKCDRPALVHISSSAGEDNEAGESLRHLCLQCAAEEDFPVRRERRLNFAAVLIVVGFFVTCICVFADYLGFGNDEQFGVKQLTSTGLGIALVVCAAFVRIPTVLVIGLFIIFISVLADRLAIGLHPGFGGQQITGGLIGIALIAAGLIWASRRTESAPPP